MLITLQKEGHIKVTDVGALGLNIEILDTTVTIFMFVIIDLHCMHYKRSIGILEVCLHAW